MKKINYIFKIFVILVFSLITSCSLDVSPKDDDEFTNADFYANPNSYKQFLAKIYAGLAVTGQNAPDGDSDLGSGAGAVNEGFSQYLRGWWQLQELTSDEAIIAWGESENKTIRDLNFNSWDADNVFGEAFFARVYYQVGLVNEFLRETTDEKLSGRGVSGTLYDEVQLYKAEARFLRALSYYHGIDVFGAVPFGTEESLLGTPPVMKSRAEMFDYIISELNSIESIILAPRSNVYGRVDRAAIWMLKAKLYMNSQVYTGVDRSNEALTEINKVIASGYTIAQIPHANLFKADNGSNGAQNEFIFPICFDGVKTKSWGGTTFLLRASCTSAVAQTLGITGGTPGWSGFRVRKEFADMVGNTDARVRYIVGNTDQADIYDYTVFSQGKKLLKYSNLNADGTAGSNGDHADTDFPLFRLADAYLMYAELAAVNGKGSMTTALGYVNDLRSRAGVGPATMTELSTGADFILKERGKELYWEGHRRQDLIRLGKYLSGYTWQWKGGVQSGTDLESKRLLFAIPNKELRANSNLSQNIGY